MPLPLSGKFLIADVVEIQKKSVITYATFSLITITRKLRRNYGCRNYGFHYARTLPEPGLCWGQESLPHPNTNSILPVQPDTSVATGTTAGAYALGP